MPDPIRPVQGARGAPIAGPSNPALEAQAPFTLSPPSTDHGTMPNLKWSFSDSHMRLEEGGWARQTTIRDIEGEGRMTVFGSESKARTFDYRAGDVGYVPFAMGHYIENTGTTTLRFLEVFRSSRYADVSLNQWMRLTPPQLVRSHLNIAQSVLDGLSVGKRPVLPG